MGLLDIKPNIVSRNLNGYTNLIFGEPKVGKTTLVSKFPKHLLLAFEIGYTAIPGIMAQPISKWVEAKKILKELADPSVKEAYEVIGIDTADLMLDMAEKFILGREGVGSISEIPYGGGYRMVAKEIDEFLQQIKRLGYGIVLISHSTEKTFKDVSGKEFNRTAPTLSSSGMKIVTRFVDNIIYVANTGNGFETSTITGYLRGTNRFMAGSRFKYITDKIEFSYDNLVKAIHDAIDTQEKLLNGSTTDEKKDFSHLIPVEEEMTPEEFSNLMQGTNKLIQVLLQKDENNRVLIQSIIESTLGIGKKLGQLNITQGEMLRKVNESIAIALESAEMAEAEAGE